MAEVEESVEATGDATAGLGEATTDGRAVTRLYIICLCFFCL
jgi:hypothetical protein